MSPEQAQLLGYYLRDKRQARDISARSLAQQVGVNLATIVRLEKGEIKSPRLEILSNIARSLDLPLADLYGLAGYQTTEELPSFTPYLRTKYRELPDEAVAELTAYLKRLQTKHGLSTGPVDGEDER